MNSILLLNKPLHLSSSQAVQKIKRLFKADKAGHAGTLDPLATGMLPICLNKATKINQFLLKNDKSYQATIQLGTLTDTGDLSGQVIAQKPSQHLLFDTINQVVKSHQGEQWQTPPHYSAVKHQGKPLYSYARKGIQINKPARKVNISQIDLLRCTQSDDGLLCDIEITCSSGTYIRSLAESIGTDLGCGATLAKLHRCWCDPFRSQTLCDLKTLENMDYCERFQQLLPIERVLGHMPKCCISENDMNKYLSGQPIELNQTSQPKRIDLTKNAEQTQKCLVFQAQQLIGIADIQGGHLQPRILLYGNR